MPPWVTLRLQIPVLQRGGQQLLQLDDVGRLMAHLEHIVATNPELPKGYSTQSLLQIRVALSTQYASTQIYN